MKTKKGIWQWLLPPSIEIHQQKKNAEKQKELKTYEFFSNEAPHILNRLKKHHELELALGDKTPIRLGTFLEARHSAYGVRKALDEKLGDFFGAKGYNILVIDKLGSWETAMCVFAVPKELSRVAAVLNRCLNSLFVLSLVGPLWVLVTDIFIYELSLLDMFVFGATPVCLMLFAMWLMNNIRQNLVLSAADFKSI